MPDLHPSTISEAWVAGEGAYQVEDDCPCAALARVADVAQRGDQTLHTLEAQRRDYFDRRANLPPEATDLEDRLMHARHKRGELFGWELLAMARKGDDDAIARLAVGWGVQV